MADRDRTPPGGRPPSGEWLGALSAAMSRAEQPSLASLLRDGSPSPSERWELERALAFPWSWPGREAVARVSELAEFDPPSAPKPGETCVVSASADERVALWALAPTSFVNARPLVDSAARDALNAIRVATSHLPLVATVRPLTKLPTWSARLVAKVGVGSDRVLDGGSFGLAFVLAAASMLLDVPVPTDLCALAALGDDGSLKPVGALGEKLWMLTAWAPSVRRVVVASRQAPRAADVVQAGSLGLTVISVSTVAEALEAVFPGAVTEPDLPAVDAPSVRRTLEDVYRVAIEGTPAVIDWSALARAAARLGEHAAIRCDPFAREEARIAEAIAWRHAGRAHVVAWPTAELLVRYPRPVRLRVVAHAVQSVADTPMADVGRFVAEASTHVAAPGEEHAEDLELLGAMGRALASAGQTDEAVATLVRAADGWIATWRPDGASHALAELLRVHGSRLDAGAVGRTIERFVPPVLAHPRTPEVSRAFVHLAAGRALASVGAYEQGLTMLDAAIDWSECPRHLQLSRLRWRANALWRLGRREDGHRVRRELALKGSGTAYPALAALDLALATHDDPRPALASLESVAEDELARWHVPGQSPADLGRRAAYGWRY